ncbi:tumor protein p53-inducible nuclear protein 2 [Zootermopsis nevadensis]|uniref:Tumor protein p53-inducible nuclear protein 1 n=1 Tax=Zootermopsis nevadensis TaxID=136037 RepID=A0A067QW14_ZOONE|nr:tumor protein p53-inducible nuclear protein 2 [Zootermopsis nevadensis]XP_021929777.1 tumor protein p53-inducible nuclear protein 2 [Zootermopsis nevadensis]XP_021929778.1 tumor protein p53-inducible nuclear protein 2 [Zootermopsis nevadensis]KDR14245.1 Tumor protein p53-inducible nuclear protein 1 [Zootermopsis nevadensis]
MFSSLASYLLGNQSLSPEAETAEVRLRAVDSDDDWVLVEKTEDDRSEHSEESSETLSALELTVSTIPHPFPPPYRLPADTTDYHSLTWVSSSTLPSLSFEESWFLTPPPCFTSEGPIHMETSPLENLLIEHPSMSVYQHSSSTHCSLPCPRRRSGSTGTAPNSPASSLSGEEADPPRPEPAEAEHVIEQTHSTAQATPRQRHAIYSLHKQQERECLPIRSAQKLRQRRACQLLKRNHLDRSNKAREINSRNKCQRRSDHMQHHSGANNNRKC